VAQVLHKMQAQVETLVPTAQAEEAAELLVTGSLQAPEARDHKA
jgi:hypothetical protein